MWKISCIRRHELHILLMVLREYIFLKKLFLTELLSSHVQLSPLHHRRIVSKIRAHIIRRHRCAFHASSSQRESLAFYWTCESCKLSAHKLAIFLWALSIVHGDELEVWICWLTDRTRGCLIEVVFISVLVSNPVKLLIVGHISAVHAFFDAGERTSITIRQKDASN